MNGARISAIWWNAEWISCLAYWLCSWWMLRELLAFASFYFLTANDSVFRYVCAAVVVIQVRVRACWLPYSKRLMCDMLRIKMDFLESVSFECFFFFVFFSSCKFTRANTKATPFHSNSLFTIKWPQWFSKFYANKIYLLHCYTRRAFVCFIFIYCIASSSSLMLFLKRSCSIFAFTFAQHANEEKFHRWIVVVYFNRQNPLLFYLLFSLLRLWEH